MENIDHLVVTTGERFERSHNVRSTFSNLEVGIGAPRVLYRLELRSRCRQVIGGSEPRCDLSIDVCGFFEAHLEVPPIGRRLFALLDSWAGNVARRFERKNQGGTSRRDAGKCRVANEMDRGLLWVLRHRSERPCDLDQPLVNRPYRWVRPGKMRFERHSADSNGKGRQVSAWILVDSREASRVSFWTTQSLGRIRKGFRPLIL